MCDWEPIEDRDDLDPSRKTSINFVQPLSPYTSLRRRFWSNQPAKAVWMGDWYDKDGPISWAVP